MEENKKKLDGITNYLYKLSSERKSQSIDSGKTIDLLSKRMKDAVDMQNGNDRSNDEDDLEENCHASTAVLLGSNVAVKNAVRPIKLTEVQKLPPYTTWIFLDRFAEPPTLFSGLFCGWIYLRMQLIFGYSCRNQRMTEDQSVLGRRRIYYDQNGGEALICSDSEEEAVDDEEEKRNFVEAEDFLLR